MLITLLTQMVNQPAPPSAAWFAAQQRNCIALSAPKSTLAQVFK